MKMPKTVRHRILYTMSRTMGLKSDSFVLMRQRVNSNGDVGGFHWGVVSRRSPEYWHAVKLQRSIGIPIGEAREWLRRREMGSCAICGTTDDLAVDHDHLTGKPRDILCRPDNLLIGYLERLSPAQRQKALDYTNPDEWLKSKQKPSED